MKATYFVLAIAALASDAAAVVLPRTTTVTGTPEGFGAGTTGGGSATPAIPSSVAQLKEWLMDDVARVIVLDKE